MTTKRCPSAMTTRLLSTGTHIGAAKLPRTLRIAPKRCPDAVEEQLRQEEPGEGDRQLALRGRRGVGVRADDRRREDHGEDRDDVSTTVTIVSSRWA